MPKNTYLIPNNAVLQEKKLPIYVGVINSIPQVANAYLHADYISIYVFCRPGTAYEK